MKKSRSLGEYVDDNLIKNAKREKEKYQKYLDNNKKEKQENKGKDFPNKKRKRMDIPSYITFLLSRREYSEKEIRKKWMKKIVVGNVVD